jgi:hypothetical protein
LFTFFIQHKNTSVYQLWAPNFKNANIFRWYRISKTLVIGIILIDSLAMYIQANNFNDDNYPRPTYHGAYQVQSIFQHEDTIPLSLDSIQQWKRIFIHRRGYLISQDRMDTFQDYKMRSVESNVFQLTHSQTQIQQRLIFQEKEDTVVFNFISTSDTLQYLTLPINLETLPLL